MGFVVLGGGVVSGFGWGGVLLGVWGCLGSWFEWVHASANSNPALGAATHITQFATLNALGKLAPLVGDGGGGCSPGGQGRG